MARDNDSKYLKVQGEFIVRTDHAGEAESVPVERVKSKIVKFLAKASASATESSSLRYIRVQYVKVQYVRVQYVRVQYVRVGAASPT